MRNRWSYFFNTLILLFLLTFLAGFQGTFWFQIFGELPAPLLWLNLIVYVALYRKPGLAIFTIYLMGFMLLAFTGMPLKMMWTTLIILFAIIYIIKTRVFWSGPWYYTLMCAFSSAAYHLIYFFTSLVIEDHSASPEILQRTAQIILTPIFAVPIYWLLSRIDVLLEDELTKESGGLEL